MMKMKMKIRILIFILIFCPYPVSAWANPFRSSYVCIPPLNPNASGLEFHIQEGQNCREGEQLAKVSPQRDGSILLLPSEAPLPATEQKELEEFKKYYGIER
jgi:hypothetical protein